MKGVVATGRKGIVALAQTFGSIWTQKKSFETRDLVVVDDQGQEWQERIHKVRRKKRMLLYPWNTVEPIDGNEVMCESY